MSSTDNPSISLLNPEANLYPSIFFISKDDNILGCIPNYIYKMNADSSTSNIASLKAHNYARGRDGTLATSHS